MKATARAQAATLHAHVTVRSHQITFDEPESNGGDDEGPSPQELLAAASPSCIAVTIEMYATRKGWDVGAVEVDCRFTPAERGCPTRFELVLRLPAHLTDEQVERLQVIAGQVPGAPHARGRGHVRRADRRPNYEDSNPREGSSV